MAEPKDLEPLLLAGDVAGCVAYFRGMPEKERRAHARLALTTLQDVLDEWLQQDGERVGFERRPGWQQRRDAAFAAAWASANLRDLTRANIWPEGAVWEVLEDRRPDWLADWAEAEVARFPSRIRVVQEAIDRGLIGPPEHDNYIAGHILLFDQAARAHGLAAELRRHPDFLEHTLWQLFEVDGTSDCNLAGHDKYSGPNAMQWSTALVELAGDGTVSRSRLLDASLTALARDFVQFRAGWFSRFHEQLAPTLQERIARRPAYLHLLGSTIPPTVSFALDALVVLDKAGALPAQELVAMVSPALLARAKGTVKLALRLLRNAVRREPEREAEVATMVAQALLHEAADVQGAVLDLLDSVGADVPELRDAVQLAAGGVAPSLQGRLTKWRAEAPPPPDDVRPTVSSRHAEPVRPIADPDEFVRELAAVLEDASDPAAVERVVDGIARFFRAELDLRAQVKRASVLRKSGDTVQTTLADAVLCWQANRRFTTRRGCSHASTIDLLRQRMTDLFEFAPLGHRPLSIPTDTRGFIDAATLVARASTFCDTGVADRVLALLRLSPAHRRRALPRAAAVPGEFGAALRYALGDDDAEIGGDVSLWIAAARARNPVGDDPRVDARHPDTGPGGALAARCAWGLGTRHDTEGLVLLRAPKCPRSVPTTQPTVLFHHRTAGSWFHDNGAACHSVAAVRWSATVAPGCTEDYFAVGVERIDVDWWEAHWEVRHFFEPMLYADVAFGPNACRLLALGLAAKEAGQWGMAVDCVLTGVADGRLRPAALGAAMAELLGFGQVNPGRWARSLREVARVADACARFSRDALEHALAADPARMPKGIGKLLEEFHELCVRTGAGVTSPLARAYLAAVRTGGKTAQVKRALLDL